MTLRRILSPIAAIGVTMTAVLTPISPAAASSNVPFKDPNSAGNLTLCGRDGRPVTSGDLLTAPFVWSAISSESAPDGYSRAYLLVYQPIQNVDPGDWTGAQLTEDAIFSNPHHPVAQATNADVPILYADHSMPPRWNGLFQLRMYFTAPNKPVDSSPYPSAVIRVSGQNWSLLTPATTPCNAGTAVSAETFRLPKSELDTPQSIFLSSGAKSSSTQATTPGRPAIVAPSPLPTTLHSTGKQAVGLARSGSGGSNWTALWIALGVLLAAGAAFGSLLVLRRRNSLSNPGG